MEEMSDLKRCSICTKTSLVGGNETWQCPVCGIVICVACVEQHQGISHPGFFGRYGKLDADGKFHPLGELDWDDE